MMTAKSVFVVRSLCMLLPLMLPITLNSTRYPLILPVLIFTHFDITVYSLINVQCTLLFQNYIFAL